MTRPRRLLSILSLRCDSATGLASRELDEPLDVVDRLALAGHMLICHPCRRFRRQVRFLRAACRRRSGPPPDADGPDEALSAEARARILRALRGASPGEPS